MSTHAVKEIRVYDFRKYTESGFVITTSDNYPTTYRSLGIIYYDCVAGTMQNGQGWIGCTDDEMISKLVESIKSVKGNGLIDLKIVTTVLPDNRTKFTSSGLAIQIDN